MTDRRKWTPWLAMAMVVPSAVAACTRINAVDVCDRDRAAEGEANILHGGSQFTDTARPLAAMPDDRPLLAFTSDFSGTDATRREVRGVRLGAEATPIVTCDAPREHTYAAADPAASPVQNVGANLAAPLDADNPGLLVYVRQTSSGSDIMAVPFDPQSACRWFDLTPESIGVIPGGGVPTSPAVVRTGPTKFLVLWTAAHPTDPASPLFARAVDTQPIGIQLDPLLDGDTGDIVDDRPARVAGAGTIASKVDAVVADDAVAAVWYSVGAGGAWRVRMGIFDFGMRPRIAPFDVSETFATVHGSARPPVIAWDGRQLMVVWVQPDEAGTFRVMGRFLTVEGDYVTSAVTRDGEPFRLPAEPRGEEGSPALIDLPGGGFLAAWSAQGGDAAGQGVRAAAFDSVGQRQFTNLACGRSDFELNAATAGDQGFVALARLADDSIAAAWTDRGKNGADSSGWSVRAALFRERDLLPRP